MRASRNVVVSAEARRKEGKAQAPPETERIPGVAIRRRRGFRRSGSLGRQARKSASPTHPAFPPLRVATRTNPRRRDMAIESAGELRRREATSSPYAARILRRALLRWQRGPRWLSAQSTQTISSKYWLGH